MQLIDGKALAQKIREELKEQVDSLKVKGIYPKLAVVLVGDNPASKVYVKNKSKACEKTGIEFEEVILPKETSEEALRDIVESLNNREDINGILVQSPLPRQINENTIFSLINPEKDVDGFNPVNVGKLCIGEDAFVSCTPFGVIKMLEAYDIETEGKKATILGRSNIVGKPMIQCMLKKNATVTVCHSKTQNIGEILRDSDIIISAIGKPKFVKEEMVKDGAVVIDVGINRLDDGSIVGDVDFENVSKKVSYITPVPGGVGPMTIAMLLSNVVKATKLQNGVRG